MNNLIWPVNIGRITILRLKLLQIGWDLFLDKILWRYVFRRWQFSGIQRQINQAFSDPKVHWVNYLESWSCDDSRKSRSVPRWTSWTLVLDLQRLVEISYSELFGECFGSIEVFLSFQRLVEICSSINLSRCVFQDFQNLVDLSKLLNGNWRVFQLEALVI